MKTRMFLSGFKSVGKLFKEYSNEIRQIVEEEIEATVYDIQAEAQSLVPVDKGFLKNSIVAEFDSNNLEGEVRAESNYAGYQEWGTGGLVDVPEGVEEMAIRWKGQGIRQVNLPPQPFMHPAFENNAPKMIDRIKKRIGDIK